MSGVKFIVFDELYSKFPDTDFYKELPDVHVYVRKLDSGYTLLEMHSKKEMEGSIKRFWDYDK